MCTSCNPGPVFKIQFKFRRLEIPPNYSVHHLGCIGGCDDILRQLVEICGTGSRSSSNNLGSSTESNSMGSRDILDVTTPLVGGCAALPFDRYTVEEADHERYRCGSDPGQGANPKNPPSVRIAGCNSPA
ncbi:DNA topoisomerase 3-alpha [Datura stramonium]|uniref:DNA topoisomerase 3-alpha n=1 Tax=Datura stramonium TaxID=4076 RepID=A0ABS8TNZ1_DATST|nr:DNA topoisomerase 3-alpha [Datura stramonium]